MKKLQYIQPAVEFTETALVQMLADSGVRGTGGGVNLGYGGVDLNSEEGADTKDDKYDWDW